MIIVDFNAKLGTDSQAACPKELADECKNRPCWLGGLFPKRNLFYIIIKSIQKEVRCERNSKSDSIRQVCVLSCWEWNRI